MRRTTLSPLLGCLAALAVLVLTGCPAWYRAKLVGPPWATVFYSPYHANHECSDDPEATDEQRWNERAVAVSPSQWARWVMCKPGRSAWEHAPPLEADPDPVVAAGMVSVFAAHYQEDRRRPARSWAQLAMVWDLARRVDPGAVAAELSTRPLAPRVQAAFVARYQAAQQHVRELVAAETPHWRRVFLAPALAARKARAAADHRLTPWQDKVAALRKVADAEIVDGKASARTLQRAEALRRAYVAACTAVRGDARVCLADPVGWRLRELIARHAKATGDDALVAAEESLERNLAHHGDPRYDDYLGARAAFDAEKARFAAYAKVRDSGVSAEALAARWPEPPLDLGDAEPAIGLRTEQPRHFYANPGRGTEVIEQVRAVARHGRDATVLFRRNVEHGYQATGCYQTSRVSSIDRHGNVYYQERCTGPDRAYALDHTVEPVHVPAAEVAHLRPGELIHVIVDRKTRRGHVAWVGAPRPKGDKYGRDTPPVQIREWRLR
jgi:hypothetical protein